MAVEPNFGRAWVSSLSRFGIRPGLDRTKRVLAYFSHPERGLSFFHVAGTNGKGSVCATLYQLLRTRLSVGLFTSPAFDGYQGRFIVDDESIPNEDFERLAESVRVAVETTTPDDPLTEFEVLTVMAILYFAERRVDAVVWETGLGGRFDSTNVVQTVVAAITNVGLDHVQILGPTIRHIARDKSGIIKAGCPVVTAASGEALDVIREHARQVSANLFVAGSHFGFARRTVGQWALRSRLDYRGVYQDIHDIPVMLYGRHQAQNASVALAMLEFAMKEKVIQRVTPSEIRMAMRRVVWPGRFEVMHSLGRVTVLDGAHNPPGARALADALRELAMSDGGHQDEFHHPAPWTMVIGILGDKDVRGILRPLLPLAKRVITVMPENPRALTPLQLGEEVRRLRPDVELRFADSVEAGMRQAMAASMSEFICCFGSLYTVDAARKAMENMQPFGKQGR